MTRPRLQVNPLSRDQNTLESELSFRGKVARMPTFIPRIDTDLDVEALTRRGLMYNPSVLCFRLPSVRDVLAFKLAAARQTDLLLRPLQSDFEQLLQHALVLVDPRTEALYFGGKGSQDRMGLMKSVSLPRRLEDIFGVTDTKNHTRSWVRASNQDLLLALVDAFFTTQYALGADIIIPPSPLLTGESLGVMLDILERVNLRTRIAAAEAEVYPALYLPLHSRLFRSPEALDAIMEVIESSVAIQHVLFFKVVWFANLDRTEDRINLGRFLARIDEIKQAHADRLSVICLEAGTEGHAMLFNGVDGFVEPISGRVGPPKRSSKDADRTLYGSYLDPKSREPTPWKTLKNRVSDNDGYLPHDCMVCERLHGFVSEADLDSLTWNVHRRAHHYNVRMADVEEKVKSAIGSKSVREEFAQWVTEVDPRLRNLAPPKWGTTPM